MPDGETREALQTTGGEFPLPPYAAVSSVLWLFPKPEFRRKNTLSIKAGSFWRQSPASNACRMH